MKQTSIHFISDRSKIYYIFILFFTHHTLWAITCITDMPTHALYVMPKGINLGGAWAKLFNVNENKNLFAFTPPDILEEGLSER